MWAIQSFESFKSPGLDGIFPKMLQETITTITPILCLVYKECLKQAHNFIPLSWNKVKVIFIPKSGKVGHSKAKDYRPISLTSFLLKIIERLLHLHIRSLFSPILISKSQHAYIKGRSTDTALHELVNKEEKTIEHTALLDIEGGFNNVTNEAIERALRNLRVKDNLILWLLNMLRSRIVISTIGCNTTTKYLRRGTPQRGVISPLLWLLVINEILLVFDKSYVNVTAYADDY